MRRLVRMVCLGAMTLSVAGASRGDDTGAVPAPPPAEAAVAAAPAPEGSSTPGSLTPGSEPQIEPTSSHPPWSGREAIWGGVGLIIVGVGGLIASPACTTLRSGGIGTAPAGTAGTGANPQSVCLEAVLGSAAGAAGLGGILLAVGELQRASYKEWLRTHPMFGGFGIGPTMHGARVTWALAF